MQMFLGDKLFRSLNKLHLEFCFNQLHGTQSHKDFNLGNSVIWGQSIRKSELPERRLRGGACSYPGVLVQAYVNLFLRWGLDKHLIPLTGRVTAVEPGMLEK